MFNKKLLSGKYRFTEKYFTTSGEWKTVCCTMNSARREAKAEAHSKLEKSKGETFKKHQKKYQKGGKC